MKRTRKGRGFGWLRDVPDHRDYSPETVQIGLRLQRAGMKEPVRRLLERTGAFRESALPASADLRPWCPPIEHQGDLGSCTAHAAAAAVEYFERRAFGRHLEASRLFIYKTTRALDGLKGDVGAQLRTTMGALAIFGVPPEEYWPYDIRRFDREPPAFCYAFASNYQALAYYRLDKPGVAPEALLRRIKTNLAANLPAVFGFTVFSGIDRAERTGEIPFPALGESVVGGHAVLAVGYDDARRIPSADGRSPESVGAVLVRNSWGEEWGEKGYGWLPYEYVARGLAVDWWSLVKCEWIDTGEFRS